MLLQLRDKNGQCSLLTVLRLGFKKKLFVSKDSEKFSVVIVDFDVSIESSFQVIASGNLVFIHGRLFCAPCDHSSESSEIFFSRRFRANHARPSFCAAKLLLWLQSCITSSIIANSTSENGFSPKTTSMRKVSCFCVPDDSTTFLELLAWSSRGRIM